jgi:hypothetical protein
LATLSVLSGSGRSNNGGGNGGGLFDGLFN